VPKERTHWLLARRAARNRPSGPLADAALAYPEHLLVGAVTHDTGYYALGDPAAQAVADRAHGAGGADSFQRFRALADHRYELGAAGLVFGFGALTHLAADAVFHPLVFSWTGDKDAADPALRHGWLFRHQSLETDLDLFSEGRWGDAPALTYGALVREAGPILGACVDAFLGAPSRRWIRAHGRLQALFHHGTVRELVKAWSWGRRRGDGDWSGAFYPPGGRATTDFEGTLGWVDPVTGQDHQATFDDLVARFDALVQDLATAWERAWATGAVPFEGRVGPALDTGIRGDRDQTKKHFRPHPTLFR
jgi:hypothetical protein